jgi:nucleotide-binding universal stress UspA family protein
MGRPGREKAGITGSMGGGAVAIKPIVVGTDGSEPSLRAVDWATREAVLRDVPLRIVSVCTIEPRINWIISPGSGCGRLCETAGKALQEAGDRAGTRPRTRPAQS